MKKSLILALSCLFLLAGAGEVSAFSTAGTCKIDDGTVYVSWLTYDEDDNIHVWVATGSVTDDPTSWTATEVSVGGASSNIGTPILNHNSTTGTVVVWQYFDLNLFVMRVAAAVLPAGSDTWSFQLISDNTNEVAGFYDNTTGIDDLGNIMVTWSAFDQEAQNYVVRAAAASIYGDTVTWGNSFVIPGADSKKIVAKPNAQQQKALGNQVQAQQKKKVIPIAMQNALGNLVKVQQKKSLVSAPVIPATVVPKVAVKKHDVRKK